MMNEAALARWLVDTEATVNILENARQTGDADALQQASQKLNVLTSELKQLPPQPSADLAKLLARLNTVLESFSQQQHSAGGQIDTLRQHGRALNAYLVSDFKNPLPKR